MKTKQRNARRAILAITLAMIMCMMTAAPAAAGQKYPYIKATGTNGHFEGEAFYTQGILLECEHFRGKYWTRRKSDGWLYLAKLAKDPMEAGQVFLFDRTNAVYTPGDKYGAHYEHTRWHQIIAENSPRGWLSKQKNGFYFGDLAFNNDGSDKDEILWSIRVVKNAGAYQVIRIICKSGTSAAAAGWGEAIPHEWV